MHSFTSQLHVNYINCFIQKQKKLSDYPYQFKPHMYALQKMYIDELFAEKKYVNKHKQEPRENAVSNHCKIMS